MGYLLKNDGKVLMFYSKPVLGYYSNSRCAIDKSEYLVWKNENLVDEMVFTPDVWYDVSNFGEKYARGVEIDELTLDCIVQGDSLENNKLYEFGLI